MTESTDTKQVIRQICQVACFVVLFYKYLKATGVQHFVPHCFHK